MKKQQNRGFYCHQRPIFLQKYNEEIKKTAVWADLMSFFLIRPPCFPTNSPPSSAARVRQGATETSTAKASLFFLYFDLRPLIYYLQYSTLKRPHADPSTLS